MSDTHTEPDTRPFPTQCEKCHRSIDDCNINWNAPRDPVCVVCAYPKPAPWMPGGEPILTRTEAKRALARLHEDDDSTCDMPDDHPTTWACACGDIHPRVTP